MHARLLGLCLLGSATAYANPVSPAPGFALLDRQDGVSRVGGDATYFVVDGGDATVFRFDLHGHFVDPGSRVGGYAALPIAYVDDDAGGSSTAVGNLEVGLIFLPRLSSRTLGLVAHVGATLPTGDTDEDALTGFIISFMRPADIYQALPRSSTIRLGVSPIYRDNNVFARFDFGLDINVYLKDSSEEADPAIHIGAGGGYDTGSVAIMGELSILSSTGDNSDTIVVGAVSARGTGGSIQPYGSLVIPLDDDVGDIFDLGILFGVEGKL